jgi:hypothetical protein
MPTLEEIENFLASCSLRDCDEQNAYRVNMTNPEKRKWIVENPNYTKTQLFKMRLFGRKAWANFLWSFGLEETVTISRIKKG